jgi:hypothetical protein
MTVFDNSGHWIYDEGRIGTTFADVLKTLSRKINTVCSAAGVDACANGTAGSRAPFCAHWRTRYLN